MSGDLSCPLTESCKAYKKYLSEANKDTQNIICKPAGQYFCMALYKINQYGTDTDECALIQLLNNTDALLKLGAKGTL